MCREDLPADVRRSIHQGALSPLLTPEETTSFQQVIVEVFREVLEIYLDDHELRWRCDHVHRVCPDMPMEAVFLAISVELGVSVSRLRDIWFTSRRKARVRALVSGRLKVSRKASPEPKEAP